MRKYEITYLVSDEVRENDLNKVTGAVAGFVTELGGKVAKEEIWGRRKLAYPIKKRDFATYVTLNFEMPSEKCPEFEREVRHNSSILRHLVIIKEHGHEAITLSAAEIAETAEIEEVIGGEKSFEAVEGQTEESFDLMAKRETESQSDGETEKEAPKVVAELPKSPELPDKAPKTPRTPELPKSPEVSERKTKVKTAKLPETPKTPKSPRPKKTDKSSDEAERLSKLNEELDDILKDEL